MLLIKEHLSDMASKLLASGQSSGEIDLNIIESNLKVLMSGKFPNIDLGTP
jgi:hypothetical protein